MHVHDGWDRRCTGAVEVTPAGEGSAALQQCSCRAAELPGCLQQVWAGLAQCLPLRRGAGTPGSFGFKGLGWRDHLALHLPLLCDFIVLRLLSAQTAVGKLRAQILQAVLPQNLNFPCGSAGRDRCLAGRFSFTLLDQTKASNLQEFKCSNRNILALPSLKTCIINISWKN